MTLSSTSPAVIWAIDPFETKVKPDENLVHRLTAFLQASGLSLQPVHILAPPTNTTGDFLQEGGTSRYVVGGEKALDQYVRGLGVIGAKPAKILLPSDSSREAATTALLDLAKRCQSPCIIVSSRGQSGLERLILGSFAENLLLKSTLPVVFLSREGQSTRSHKPSNSVLFSTDFSDFSRHAFLQFLDVAKRLNVKLCLYHIVTLPTSALVSGYDAAGAIADDYFPAQIEWAKTEAAKWKKIAERHGVESSFAVAEGGVGQDIGEAVLRQARMLGASFIALASTSGAIGSMLIGSVARDIFRVNEYPVWVYGPKALGEDHKAIQAKLEAKPDSFPAPSKGAMKA